VKGIVRDASSQSPVAAATVEISGRLHTTQTTEEGEYWRLLLPGTYEINVGGLLISVRSSEIQISTKAL